MSEIVQRNDMSAILLAGGKSSRMGRDKSAVLFDGEPLLLRSLNTLQSMFGEVIIVTNQDIPFDIPGAKVVRDDVPFQGPLGGISAGLKSSSRDINFIIAVDMPFISPQVVDYLARFTGEADVIAPMTTNGFEPLFAFYSKRCVDALNDVLAAGERKILSLLGRIDLKVIGYNEIRNLPGADSTFLNINTERELEEAEAKAHHTKAPKTRDDLRTPIERPVTVFVNSDELVTVQSSMEHLDEVACGFLVSEGILQDRDDLESVRVDEERGEVRVRTKTSKTNATKAMGKRFITSGCGKGFSFVSLGDAMGIAPLKSAFSVEKDTIPNLMKEFLHSSGRPGMHSSAVVKDGEISLIRQDIGRHNTVDMILGKLWLDGVTDRDIMLFTTGRISYEMVVKAAKARIPILVSRTAATDLAVRLANRIGIEVVGYVRAGNMKVYTEGARLGCSEPVKSKD
ncbi:MAG TPA: formate dehydrogenase accessory sulfurtransferase FdhD [Candidatus Aquicultor sp.]|jgi:FdhD protein